MVGNNVTYIIKSFLFILIKTTRTKLEEFLITILIVLIIIRIL